MTDPKGASTSFDPRVRVAEIKQENHGDVSWVDIDWLCSVALAACDVAVLTHGYPPSRVQSSGRESIPKNKLRTLRSYLGMPRD